jgi:RNA-binding protein
MAISASPGPGKLRRFLRAEAHALRPVVAIGRQGLSPSVLKEIDGALGSHELIKIQYAGDKTSKQALSQELENRLGALNVGIVGHVLIVFRQNAKAEDRKVQLPRGLGVS